ncbi:MAG: hypothetical protein IPJ20_09040 [Flammeovirgaceae bacterium]|nr:hypothetical protein [Flammeovirgaceae bacterium]
MKAFLSFFFLLFVITTYAQTFEGTIAWSIKTEITDPKNESADGESPKANERPCQSGKNEADARADE